MTEKNMLSEQDCKHGIYLLERSMSFMWAAALRAVALRGGGGRSSYRRSKNSQQTG